MKLIDYIMLSAICADRDVTAVIGGYIRWVETLKTHNPGPDDLDEIMTYPLGKPEWIYITRRFFIHLSSRQIIENQNMIDWKTVSHMYPIGFKLFRLLKHEHQREIITIEQAVMKAMNVKEWIKVFRIHTCVPWSQIYATYILNKDDVDDIIKCYIRATVEQRCQMNIWILPKLDICLTKKQVRRIAKYVGCRNDWYPTNCVCKNVHIEHNEPVGSENLAFSLLRNLILN